MVGMLVIDASGQPILHYLRYRRTGEKKFCPLPFVLLDGDDESNL